MEVRGCLASEAFEQPRRGRLWSKLVDIVEDEYQVVCDRVLDALAELPGERLGGEQLLARPNRGEVGQRDQVLGQAGDSPAKRPREPTGQNGQARVPGTERVPRVFDLLDPRSQQSRLAVAGPGDDRRQSFAKGLVESSEQGRAVDQACGYLGRTCRCRIIRATVPF